MSDRTIEALRRRLEKWELQHLRALAAELRDRLDRAEDDASRAWERADYWQRNATDMQLELMEADYTVGLTKDGQIVFGKTINQASSQGGQPTFILCGPQAVRKTLHSAQIAAGLGCLHVIDDWNGTTPLPPGVLAITNGDYVIPPGGIALHIEDLSGMMNLIKLLSDDQSNVEEPAATPASWLESLVWDGKPRIDGWLHTYLGCQESPYATKVGRHFLIGTVARALEPGCWFPYCLVLVAPPGSGKSTAAKILGGDWFGDLDFDPSQRDAWSVLAGKWIYELSEMGGIVRAEQSSQKSFLDRKIDEFRPAFSRKTVKLQRQAVFIGTTGDMNFVAPSRRFWPVSCDEINLPLLAADRDQLFAEAFAQYRAAPQILSRLRLLYTPTTESSIDSACSGVVACPNCRQAIIQQGSSTSATLSTAESNSGSLWYAESTRSTQAESNDAALSREKTSGVSESMATPSGENLKSIPDAP